MVIPELISALEKFGITINPDESFEFPISKETVIGGDGDGSLVTAEFNHTSTGDVLAIHHQVAGDQADLSVVLTSDDTILGGRLDTGSGHVKFGPDGQVREAEGIVAPPAINPHALIECMVTDESFSGEAFSAALDKALSAQE